MSTTHAAGAAGLTAAGPHADGAAPASAVERWSEARERELRGLVEHHADSLLKEMIVHHMGWGDGARRGGKRVRASLCCWAAEACGAYDEVALRAACAVELIHNFTLIHDDVQDADTLRRGRPTTWSIWGEGQAINAGDFLFALGLRTLLGPPTDGDHARPSYVAAILLGALLEVVEGQCADLSYQRRPSVPVDAYLSLAERKTGALLGASLAAGAASVGAERITIARLERAGRFLGVAFQLRDDWLGTWGESQRTGKSSRSDLVRRKLTYPMVVAYQAANPAQRRELDRFSDDEAAGDVTTIRNLLDELGADARTRDAGRTWAAKAITEVELCGFAAADETAFVNAAALIIDRES